MKYRGNKSIINVKNRISAMKNNVPGNPKKMKRFNREKRNSLGQRKFSPEISLTSLVLNLLAIESTSKKEFVDIKAWLVSIEKPAYQRTDLPLIIQITNQCISATVA